MRKLLAGSVLAILLCVSFSSAELVTPRKLGHAEAVAGMSVRATLEKFKPNERASVIVSGKGATCLGLYVFDAQGNCIAKDDVTPAQASDDLTVEWVPLESACSVEVRNFGNSANAFDLAIR